MAHDITGQKRGIGFPQEGVQRRDLAPRARKEDLASSEQIPPHRGVASPHIARQILRATERIRLLKRLGAHMAHMADLGLHRAIDDATVGNRRADQRPERAPGGDLVQQRRVTKPGRKEVRFPSPVGHRHGVIRPQGGTSPRTGTT